MPLPARGSRGFTLTHPTLLRVRVSESFYSTLSARALRVRNSALMLPEPEYKAIASLARLSKAFVIEVAGESLGILLSSGTACRA